MLIFFINEKATLLLQQNHFYIIKWSVVKIFSRKVVLQKSRFSLILQQYGEVIIIIKENVLKRINNYKTNKILKIIAL